MLPGMTLPPKKLIFLKEGISKVGLKEFRDNSQQCFINQISWWDAVRSAFPAYEASILIKIKHRSLNEIIFFFLDDAIFLSISSSFVVLLTYHVTFNENIILDAAIIFIMPFLLCYMNHLISTNVKLKLWAKMSKKYSYIWERNQCLNISLKCINFMKWRDNSEVKKPYMHKILSSILVP